MIIAEVNSLLDLVGKAATFTAHLQHGWYKQSAEVNAFQDKVWILSEKHAQWSEQLRRHGMSEDKHLLRAVQVAVQVLEKQLQYVERLQKNPFLRLRKKAFPGQLSYSLSKVLEIVDAGPQLLAGRVATHELLERSLAQTPVSLPFSSDVRYVPISDSIVEIQKALEGSEGPRVVTLYEGPGWGKSSLVKHLALLYEEERKEDTSRTPSKAAAFPDGVFYLSCGQGAQGKVKQLQLELLQSLGFGASSEASADFSAAAGAQEGQYLLKLRSRLAKQKLLIILDDVWEGSVLSDLLVPGEGVRYLLTSQSREVWNAATKIQLEKPTQTEATTIMANYTEGLPTKGKFPHSIRSVTDDIIESLDGHPLSLANIGISINKSRATDLSQWEAINNNIHVALDEEDLCKNPIMYDQRYNLGVGAAMMHMVDSLPPESRGLMFLMAVLKGPDLPETLIKFFYKFLLSVPTTEFILKYNIREKYLEDRSLVQLKRRGNESILAAHSLRTHYIREKKTLDVSYIASNILLTAGKTEGITQQIKRGDADETLVAILSAIYYEEPFRDAVGGVLEHHLKIINDGTGAIPRSLNGEIDAVHLVKNTSGFRLYQISPLVRLLNPEGKYGWMQQAHDSARKIIIKLFCQDKLDDSSMASLLKLPQTTLEACSTLGEMYISQQFRSNSDRAFSSMHEETTRALLALFHDEGITTSRLESVIFVLRDVLPFESKDVILSVAPRLVELLAMDSNPELRCSAANFFSHNFPLTRASIILGETPQILQQLFWMLFGRPTEDDDEDDDGDDDRDDDRDDNRDDDEDDYENDDGDDDENDDNRDDDENDDVDRIDDDEDDRDDDDVNMIDDAEDDGHDDGHDTESEYEVQMSAAAALQGLSRCKSIGMRIACTRIASLRVDALTAFFWLFLANDYHGCGLDAVAGEILCNLSCVPENWTRFQAVKLLLQELGLFLADTKKRRGSLGGSSFWSSQRIELVYNAQRRQSFAFPSCSEVCNNIAERKSAFEWDICHRRATTIVSNLAQAVDLRKILSPISGLMIALTRLELASMAEGFFSPGFASMRGPKALAMVFTQDAVSVLTSLSPENLATLISKFSHGASPPPHSEAIYGLYKGLMEAHVKLGMYSEALSSLNIAQHHFHQIASQVSSSDQFSYHFCRWEAHSLRDWRTFLQAMLKDYKGALITANGTPERCYSTWGETAVLKRLSGDFEGALSDFNRALQLLDGSSFDLSHEFMILAHRGYVKFLMNDIAGARKNAQAAQQLKDDKLVWEKTDYTVVTESPARFLRNLPSRGSQEVVLCSDLGIVQISCQWKHFVLHPRF